jgi:iron complex transport system substrate-binding protein
MRIVSLVPAATEICFALGLDGDLVGVSPECDYPPAAKEQRVVSRVLLDYDGKTSAETSQMVGGALAAGDALYEVDEKALRELAPDVILTQGLCEVCAPSVADVRAVASRLPKRPRIVPLDPHTLRDMLEDIERVGKACGAPVAARSVVDDLRDRLERVAFLTNHAHARPKTACIEWLDPLFLAGHWVPEMVDLAGGEDTLARPGEKSRRIEPRELALANPEVAVLMPCGFHLDRARAEAASLTAQTWWRDLPAARANRVWVVDGSSYFNRPGPRLVDGLEILGHILHPEIFPRAPSTKDAVPWVG